MSTKTHASSDGHPDKGNSKTEPRSDYESHNPRTVLPAGKRAPDFTLRTTPDQCVELSELVGKPAIIVFYPADWSPVCGDQLALYNELLSEFRRFDASLVAISVDGVWCHLAYAKDRKLKFPLLSDFEPKGAVARLYGAYRSQEGVCERALFVLDEDGIIQWSYLSPIGVNPGADGVLEALEKIHSEQKQEVTT